MKKRSRGGSSTAEQRPRKAKDAGSNPARRATVFNPLAHSVVASLIRNEPHESYDATDFHEALLFAIAREIGRVHRNRFQTSWDRWSDDPHIPGIGWRRYLYNCGCPEDNDGFIPAHLENCTIAQPNFSFEDVRFTWYKNPGRGMSVNKDWTAQQWQEWFDRCVTKIREFDVHLAGGSHSIAPLPDDGAFYLAACHVMFSPALARAPLQNELSDLRNAAQLGQRQIAADDRGKRRASRKNWVLVERGELRPRDVRLIALGLMAERFRAEQDRPRASGKPGAETTS